MGAITFQYGKAAVVRRQVQLRGRLHCQQWIYHGAHGSMPRWFDSPPRQGRVTCLDTKKNVWTCLKYILCGSAKCSKASNGKEAHLTSPGRCQSCLCKPSKGIPNVPIIWTTAKPSGKAMPQSWLNNVSIINYIDEQRTLNSEGFKRFKNSRRVRRREF